MALLRQLGVMVVTLVLMFTAGSVWAPGIFIIAYVGGYAMSRYDDGAIHTGSSSQPVL